MNDVEFWIWLQRTLGSAARLDEVIGYFGSPRELYEAGRDEWRRCGVINEKTIDRLATCSPSESYTIIHQCEVNGWNIVTPESCYYPELLQKIPNYPAVLYVNGDLSCLREKSAIGVVGTRHPSRYGIESAKKIAEGLAVNDTVVVSGGAVGVDSIAHTACMDKGQQTVLVMGCGLGAHYLVQNEGLRRRVAQNGAVISEYPPFSGAAMDSFIKRNRIISGMCRGIVVIEAGEKSGSLNTASHARYQGRDVFAVPGDTRSTAFSGANRLIHEGAKAVFSADDVLSLYRAQSNIISDENFGKDSEPFNGMFEYPYGEAEKKTKRTSKAVARKMEKAAETTAIISADTQNQPVAEIKLDNLTQNAIIVYNIMKKKQSVCLVDELVTLSELSAPQLMCALTELEMEGAVNALGANRYCLR